MSRLVTDHLPLLAGAPNGVKRLRELILELAVRGKLVQQETADIPAKNLLAAIHSERTRLVKSKIIKAGKTSSENEGDPFPLPDGWSWTNLYELCSIRGGCTPSMAKSKYWDGEIPWVSPKDMHAGAIVDSELKITETALQESSLELVPVGSVLIVGRSGILKRKLPAQITSVPCTVNQDLKALTPIAPLSSTYLRLMLLGTEGDILKNDVKTGTTVQSLVFEKLFARKFGLPPQAEQHRIIAKVDELMALCDRLETRQSDAQAAHARLVDELLGSLLQARDAEEFAASWGRLAGCFEVVFSTENSVDILASAIRKLAFSGKLLSHPHEEKWVESKLKDAVSFLNGYAFKSEWFSKQGIKLARNINIGHGNIDWAEMACIDADQAEEFKNFRLKAGDILLSLDRPLISTGLKVAVVSENDLPCLLLQRVAKITPSEDKLVPDFLLHWLHSPFFMNEIDPGRSNGVPHISTKQVGNMDLLLPPLEEQHRIVAKLDELLALCDRLKARIRQARQVQERLAGALIERATSHPLSC